MQWSFGQGKYGAVIDTITGCWQDLIDMCHETAQQPRCPSLKDDSYWVAPFVIRQGIATRQIVDIDYMSAWIGLDIDRGNHSLSDLRVKTGDMPWIIYSTAHAEPDDQRWRVLLQLDRDYSVAEYGRVWRWDDRRYGLDPLTKNANRLFYVPAQWYHGLNIFHAQSGKPASVDNILAMVPPIEPSSVSQNGIGLKPAPDGTAIVTPHMMDAAMNRQRGGRLRRMMCAAAKRYRLEGWELDAIQLAFEAEQASAIFAPGQKRPGIVREAQRAIQWAATNFAPETPMQKMRNRILWQQHRFGK